MKLRLQNMIQMNEVVVLAKGTKVTVLSVEPYVKVKVLDGNSKGIELFLMRKEYLSKD